MALLYLSKMISKLNVSKNIVGKGGLTPLLNPTPSFSKFTLSSKVSSPCSTPDLLTKPTITGCHDVMIWGLRHWWKETLESADGDSYGKWQNFSEVIFANIGGIPSSSLTTRGNPETCMSCYSEISPETFYLYLATLIIKNYKIVQNLPGNERLHKEQLLPV